MCKKQMLLCFCLILFIIFTSGCAATKKVSQTIKHTDDWMKENLW